MEKNRQKGFLLAESLIVATFVISVLIFLFVQFKNLSSSFDSSFKYNTVEGLYALDNVKTYLKENASDELKISTALGNKTYISIYDGSTCDSTIGIRGTGYCKELMEQQNIKKVIFTRADITNNVDGVTSLKNHLRTTQDNYFSENMKNFILRVDVKGINHTYRLIAEFNDGSFATFNVGDENWSSSKYNDPDYVDPNYDKTATSASCFTTKTVTDGVELTGYTCSNDTIKIPSKFNGQRLIGIGDKALLSTSLSIKLKSVTFPNGIKYIGNNALETNELTAISIPESVIRIGESAFKGNLIAGELIIPDNVSIINNRAFEGNKITKVTLGAGVSTIGDAAFLSNQISSIKFNKFLNSIGNNAFASNKISSAETFAISESVTRIGAGAFQNNQITKVFIPESVTYIGDSAFKETTAWTEIDIDGENPYRFNDRWLAIGWPLDKIAGSKGFEYSGGGETYKIPLDGYYQIELWGAQGGKAICQGKTNDTDKNCGVGGKGGYTSGIAYFKAGDTLNFYVGGRAPEPNLEVAPTKGGFNGGGSGSWDTTDDEADGPGGGATDVRINGTGLANRIMVAGGGGGADYDIAGGAGGGLWGEKTTVTPSDPGNEPGKQTTGNALGNGQNGTAAGNIQAGGNRGVAGGGGGYYGGLTNNTDPNKNNNSGAGGSSFISGYAGSNAVNSSSVHTNDVIHFSGVYFLDGKMYNGNQSMPKFNGTGTETGHAGDGNARITYVGGDKPSTSSLLKKVRYIRDCTNGNSVNTGNHWTEIQAIVDGKNIVKGKTVTGISSNIALAVDGIIDNTGSYASAGAGTYCAYIDLGKEYNLEELVIWHWFKDGRYYKENIVSVKGASGSYRNIFFGNNAVETVNGIRIK